MHKSTFSQRRRVWLPIILICVFALLFTVTSPAWSKRDDKASIEKIISSNYQYMNDGNYEKMLDFYTNDAVLMLPFAPSRVGKKVVSEEFRRTFEKIAFNLTFNIREVIISGKWAFVRVNAVGTMTMKSTGQSIVDSTKALYILNRQKNGSWKIARYMFNPSTPL